jgi:hypothetical protein
MAAIDERGLRYLNQDEKKDNKIGSIPPPKLDKMVMSYDEFCFKF